MRYAHEMYRVLGSGLWTTAAATALLITVYRLPNFMDFRCFFPGTGLWVTATAAATEY